MKREPRFHGTVSEKSHKTMSKIKGKDTKPEIALRRALWAKGIRYRKNMNNLPGRPDIVITKYRLAVFVDSEFFHGKDWNKKRDRIMAGTNGQYWSEKIERNIKRDAEKEAELRALGYTVLRFWSREVIKELEGCVNTIEEVLFDLKTGENTYGDE